MPCWGQGRGLLRPRPLRAPPPIASRLYGAVGGGAMAQAAPTGGGAWEAPPPVGTLGEAEGWGSAAGPRTAPIARKSPKFPSNCPKTSAERPRMPPCPTANHNARSIRLSSREPIAARLLTGEGTRRSSRCPRSQSAASALVGGTRGDFRRLYDRSDRPLAARSRKGPPPFTPSSALIGGAKSRGRGLVEKDVARARALRLSLGGPGFVLFSARRGESGGSGGEVSGDGPEPGRNRAQASQPGRGGRPGERGGPRPVARPEERSQAGGGPRPGAVKPGPVTERRPGVGPGDRSLAGGGTRPGPEEQRQAGGGARPPKPGSGIGARPRIEAWRAESGPGRTGPERGAWGPEPEPSGCGAAARLPRIRAWGRRRGRPG